jgi:D-sedoheptulose 7-phosphate isomerase
MEFESYVLEHSAALEKVSQVTLGRFSQTLSAVRDSGETLWIAGNGGSSATASHAVADFTKTVTQAGKRGIKAIALSEMVSLQTAFANDVSFIDAMSETLKLVGRKGDALLLFSVSGSSSNLLKAAESASGIGMQVLSMVGKNGAPLAKLSSESIVLDSDDYQVVENLHVTLMHWMVKELY